MAKYMAIPQSTFEDMLMDAGMLLKNFDPENPGDPDDADIICATTGGINVVCQPTFSDFFEDVDNAPNNTKEGKHLDGWNCSISTTSLGASEEHIKMQLGCADSGTGKSVIPRARLKQSDFMPSIWWVGPKGEGGALAVELKNALSTGGFSLQTTKNGKGQISVTIEGHVSLTKQDEVPMAFYVIDPDEEETPGGGTGGTGGTGGNS